MPDGGCESRAFHCLAAVATIEGLLMIQTQVVNLWWDGRAMRRRGNSESGRYRYVFLFGKRVQSSVRPNVNDAVANDGRSHKLALPDRVWKVFLHDFSD